MKAAKKNNHYDYPVLTISKFLSNYYNVKGIGLNKLTHSQMKEMLDLKSYPYEEVIIDSIMKGKILLVRDSKNIVLGYSNPFLKKSDKECKDVFDKSTHLDVTSDGPLKIVLEDDALQCYSDYELDELIKVCKKTNNDQTKNLIIKELHNRKQSNRSKGKKINKVRKK